MNLPLGSVVCDRQRTQYSQGAVHLPPLDQPPIMPSHNFTQNVLLLEIPFSILKFNRVTVRIEVRIIPLFSNHNSRTTPALRFALK